MVKEHEAKSMDRSQARKTKRVEVAENLLAECSSIDFSSSINVVVFRSTSHLISTHLLRHLEI